MICSNANFPLAHSGQQPQKQYFKGVKPLSARWYVVDKICKLGCQFCWYYLASYWQTIFLSQVSAF